MFALRKSQKEKFSNYFFDLSKILFGSLVVKLFEPGAPVLTLGSILTLLLLGLTGAIFFVMVGVRFSKEEK